MTHYVTLHSSRCYQDVTHYVTLRSSRCNQDVEHYSFMRVSMSLHGRRSLCLIGAAYLGNGPPMIKGGIPRHLFEIVLIYLSIVILGYVPMQYFLSVCHFVLFTLYSSRCNPGVTHYGTLYSSQCTPGVTLCYTTQG